MQKNQIIFLVLALFYGLGFVYQISAQTIPITDLPVNRIQAIIRAQGEVKNGILDITISRDDIGNVQGPRDGSQTAVFTPSFGIQGKLFFQPLGNGNAFLNGEMALKEMEANPFIAVLLRNKFIFQAFHQHLPMNPQIWFVHFRGTGNAIELAWAARAALNTTGTLFPQTLPQNPGTPLVPDRLAQILHGDASVGEDGVVTIWVYRRNPILIDGLNVNPRANTSTKIEFKPLGGSRTDILLDFSMTSTEVNPVVNLMLNTFKWYQGGLYNQETNETSQLYFAHMLKTGDAYQLAEEIRQGLNLTDME